MERTRTHLYIAFLLAFCAYLFLALHMLRTGHLHEDAYILFIYAENLVGGQGITFYSGAAPIEGATDFLWMILLAALHGLGLDIAVAAAVLNGCGIGVLAASMCYAAICSLSNKKYWIVATLVCALFAVISPQARAAIGGFSSGFYCIPLCLAIVGFHRESQAATWTPFWALALALIRPDGFVLGAGLCLGAWYLLEPAARRQLLVNIGWCLPIGLAYFAFRWSYFGHFLPLPLYVKAHAQGLLPGLSINLKWLMVSAPMLAVLAWFTAFSLKEDRKRIVAACLPAVGLLILLSTGHQSQNVCLRFQSPVVTIVMVLLAFHASKGLHPSKRWVHTGFALFLLGNSALWIRHLSFSIEKSQVWDYIDVFPYIASDLYDEKTVSVITEAGRYAYWIPGVKYDLVGLNTAQSAIDGPSVEFIEEREPDIVFSHTSGFLDPLCEGQEVCVLDTPSFVKNWERAQKSDYYHSLDLECFEKRAGIAAMNYLKKYADEHQIVIVEHRGRAHHIYGIRRDGRILASALIEGLRESFRAPKFSYFDLKGKVAREYLEKRACAEPDSPQGKDVFWPSRAR